MARTMLMQAALRCPEDKFCTDNCIMAMYYDLWVYNWIPDMQSDLSNIEICLRSSFDPVSENLINFHAWSCPTYVLETKLQNPGAKMPKWYTRSQRGVIMGFSKMHSMQVGLVTNLLTGVISP